MQSTPTETLVFQPSSFTLPAPAPSLANLERPILHVGITLDALFDFGNAKRVKKEQGVDAYLAYMRQKIHAPLAPRQGLSFIKDMLSFNASGEVPLVQVSLFSYEKAAVYARAMQSLYHYGVLDRSRAVQEQGLVVKGKKDAFKRHVLNGGKCDLYLSTKRQEVISLLDAGLPAVHINPKTIDEQSLAPKQEVVAAFDYDRVLGIAIAFDSAAGKHVENGHYTQARGVMPARRWEHRNRNKTIDSGPIAPFYDKLYIVRAIAAQKDTVPDLSLAVITARVGISAHRAVNTLQAQQRTPNVFIGVGDGSKGPQVKKVGASLFIDDVPKYLDQVQKSSPETLGAQAPWRDSHLLRLQATGKYHNLHTAKVL
ncbi:MAG: 5'-nucleotidase [Alphaproteobacteria bacterium]|jgi:5'-nucleotidase|nr:5'-nucleotidase [Alphaproteobacteria bacterium]